MATSANMYFALNRLLSVTFYQQWQSKRLPSVKSYEFEETSDRALVRGERPLSLFGHIEDKATSSGHPHAHAYARHQEVIQSTATFDDIL